MSENTLRIAGIEWESIVDGPGIRATVFAQGCPHHCAGCHNQHTWEFGAGYDVNPREIVSQMKKNELITGLTISGGEPFAQARACADLACLAREADYNVIVYSGYTYEELLEMAKTDDAVRALLSSADTLIDGPFVESLRSLELRFIGSSNQRVIPLR